MYVYVKICKIHLYCAGMNTQVLKSNEKQEKYYLESQESNYFWDEGGDCH